MLGFYDYTVVLTYLSLVSAGAGIFITLSGNGHPYIGALCLLICGLCDAFDGRVARSKPDRTEAQIRFGIQIDSLTDLVAFGVLPACIGAAMLRLSPLLRVWKGAFVHSASGALLVGFFFTILILYVLAAMIRLAYFNVSEEDRQHNESGARKFYLGLPVTSASLIFPTLLLIHYLVKTDLTPMYFSAIALTGAAFVTRFPVRKPGLRGILIMIGIGALEFALMVLCKITKW